MVVFMLGPILMVIMWTQTCFRIDISCEGNLCELIQKSSSKIFDLYFINWPSRGKGPVLIWSVLRFVCMSIFIFICNAASVQCVDLLPLNLNESTNFTQSKVYDFLNSRQFQDGVRLFQNSDCRRLISTAQANCIGPTKLLTGYRKCFVKFQNFWSYEICLVNL